MSERRSEQFAAAGTGIAAWSVRHPIGTVMLWLAALVIGLSVSAGLPVSLLPDLVYPEIGVRILDRGVPARVMEDRYTRQLEEQLAITEDATRVQSTTTEGRSAVDLSFGYGTNMDQALTDASARLDRARRALPAASDAPVIFKRDPSQRPVYELVAASDWLTPAELRAWCDYELAKWFLNLPGVAAAEVGGGQVREIQVIPDPERLAGTGLSLVRLRELIRGANQDTPGGRLRGTDSEITGRLTGRFGSLEALATLRLPVVGERQPRLADVARLLDGTEDERLRIRVNGVSGVKLSIQKQPTANTVAVVEEVRARLAWLTENRLLPEGVRLLPVADQSVYIRQSLDNAMTSAALGACLAMLVVLLFIGEWGSTAIIGLAIPFAIGVTLALMGLTGLSLNMMTIGGLALGLGMVVDGAIVMLDNMSRHRGGGVEAVASAAGQVTSALIASTATTLAAVLPFLFIGGLTGLLFRELILTISIAILTSTLVALTLVPALAARQRPARAGGAVRAWLRDRQAAMETRYAGLVTRLLPQGRRLLLVLLPLLAVNLLALGTLREEFLPQQDNGRARLRITADPGITLRDMDAIVAQAEALLRAQPEVDTLFSQIGGFVFGRSEFESSNKSDIGIQLKSLAERGIGLQAWVERMRRELNKLPLAGVKFALTPEGIPGIRLSASDEDLGLRLQGPDLDTMRQLGDQIVQRLRDLPELRNPRHSLEEKAQELAVEVDRERAAALGLSAGEIGEVVRLALTGEVISDHLEGDRVYNVRLRLAPEKLDNPQALEGILLYPATPERPAIRLGDIARFRLIESPASIRRDQQRRMVEISADRAAGASTADATRAALAAAQSLPLPPGYLLYESGTLKTLAEGRDTGLHLLLVALFLTLVAMAVQYESLRDPLVIMATVPFALIGVAAALWLTGTPLSMPVWLGLIMLTGIVVNNAILFVEFIEQQRQAGLPLDEAIREAGRLRLRPILMTTLTTLLGMLPLALGLGEGSDLLRPLALTLEAGLAFSLLVTLVLLPGLYRLTRPVGNVA